MLTDPAGSDPDRLVETARLLRAEYHGNRVTWSPKVFIPLTMLCRDRCGYCTFAKPPARLLAPYLEIEEVLDIAVRGRDAGCREALFTLGERPEARYPDARDWLRKNGFDSTIHYLAEAAKIVTKETGLLAHANAGALYPDELADLRKVAPSQGMMLESLARLPCHEGSPDKTPERRLATLEAAGRLRIPFTTGLLVGIGETRRHRIDALLAIREAHLRWGHVQEVIIQNFLPKPGTAMHRHPPCPVDVLLETIALARLILPSEVHVQAPPNLVDDPVALLRAGADDWGGISPVTLDHVNPERPWPHVEELGDAARRSGYEMVARLTVHPRWVADAERWIDPALIPAVLASSDSEGLARDGWHAGGDTVPPRVLDVGPAADGPIAEVLSGVMQGEEPGEEELTVLFSARGREVAAVCEAADALRADLVGDEVTFVRNRNINYTNICTFKCRFCAFSKGPLSLNLRGTPYLLPLEEIARRAREAWDAGATEVCLQGGIHPDFDADYYLDVLRAVKAEVPEIHVHGFTALEIHEAVKRSGLDLADYLVQLRDAGLGTLPGTAAEILDDEVRRELCPDKVTTSEWLEVHEVAHSVGLRSNVTIMFGSIERPRSWARHLVATRELQKRTGGFTEFVPLPFVHMAAPIFLQGRARKGPTFREALLMHAVGRLAYGKLIPNIQVSWVKMGLAGVEQALRAGVNDLGGTLMDENISRAAGATHGQMMDLESMRSLVEAAGRRLVQRTTLYARVELV
ncbi:MAG: FO synthase [Acidimicrobiales bacterium]|nr:MAG: FO synthase [Acidimicrobiales bacterium]